MLHFLVEVIKIWQASIKFVKIAGFQQLMQPLLYSKRLENLNFWHLSSQARWMTGNSNPISRHNWSWWYMLHFLVEVIKLHPPVLKLLRYLICSSWWSHYYTPRLGNLSFWYISRQARWMTGNSNPISRHNWIYVTFSGRSDQNLTSQY